MLARHTIARSKVSILVYHDPSPETLERHLRYLSRVYGFVSLERLVTALHTQDWSEIPRHAVVVTVDDGHRGNARLGDLFQRFSVNPTIFVCSQIVGTNRHFWFIDADDYESLKALSNEGRTSRLQAMGFSHTKDFPVAERQALTHGELEVLVKVGEVGSHGRFHPILTNCSEEEASDEIVLSKEEVEALSGRSCRHFCYPNGDYGPYERRVVEEAGYASARTTDPGWNGRDGDPYRLKAFVVPDDASVNRIAATLSGLSAPLGKLARWRPRSGAVNRLERPKVGDTDLLVARPSHERFTRPFRAAGEPEMDNTQVPLRAERGKAPPQAASIVHAWLPAALPSTGRRFRVHDPALRRTLSAAGADLVDDEPDVEIGDLKTLTGVADCAIVPLDAAQGEGGPTLVRAVRRVAATARVRFLAATTRRRLRQAGYSDVAVRLWDVWSTLRLAPAGPTARHRAAADYLPQRALVIGARGPVQPTHLEASIVQARTKTRLRLEPVPPLTASGVLVMPMADGVLRVALGPGRHRLERQRAALEDLRALAPPRSVTRRVPWILAVGTCGISGWSLERKLPGSHALPPLAQSFLDDCVEFLAELHACGRGTEARPLAVAARSAAEGLGGRAAGDIVEVGEILDDLLEGVPRGFAQGDFWHENLFALEGRLVGVADWEAAGTGRLPLLDLLHFCFTSQWRRIPNHWGEELVREFLPRISANESELLRSYLERLDLKIPTRLLSAFVAAYWLERVAYQLSTYVERSRQPMWLEANVEFPIGLFLDELRSGVSPRRPARAIKGEAARR